MKCFFAFDQASCFNNPDVEAVISESLADSKVLIYSDCILAQWSYSLSNASHLSSVSFTTPSDPVTIECAVRHLTFHNIYLFNTYINRWHICIHLISFTKVLSKLAKSSLAEACGSIGKCCLYLQLSGTSVECLYLEV